MESHRLCQSINDMHQTHDGSIIPASENENFMLMRIGSGLNQTHAQSIVHVSAWSPRIPAGNRHVFDGIGFASCAGVSSNGIHEISFLRSHASMLCSFFQQFRLIRMPRVIIHLVELIRTLLVSSFSIEKHEEFSMELSSSFLVIFYGNLYRIKMVSDFGFFQNDLKYYVFWHLWDAQMFHRFMGEFCNWKNILFSVDMNSIFDGMGC